MRSPSFRLSAIAAAVLLSSFLAACQTEQLAQRGFPPERRIALESGGPHSSTAETVDVIFDYRYTLGNDQQSGREMQIAGGIKQFKIRPDILAVHINFLDDQGYPVNRKLIYVLRHSMGRDTYFRPPTTFDTTLPVPGETASFAFSSYARLSRGKR